MPKTKTPSSTLRRRSLLAGSATTFVAELTGCRGAADPTPDAYDVVVVGAGLAGLVAARELEAAGLAIAVVDARARVGGRTVSQTMQGGVVVDGGGQWVGGTQHEVIALADELGIARIPQTYEGDVVAIAGGQRFVFPADAPEEPQVVAAQAQLEALAQTIDPEQPWHGPDAEALDRQTVAQWLEGQAIDASARSAIEGTLGTTLGATASEVSLLWFAFYLRSAGGFAALDEEAQQFRLEGGAQALSLRLAERLAGKLLLGATATEIHIDDDESVRVVTSARTLVARRAIVAMMPADCERIRFEPALPAHRIALQRGWRARSGTKAHVVYPTRFWHDAGLSGLGVLDVGHVQVTFDSTPSAGTPGVLLAFCQAGDPASTLATRRAAVVRDLVALFGPAAASPLDYIELDWTKEALTAGCVSALPPGVLTAHGAALHAPAGLVHFAGSETSARWCGYLEGAVHSGRRAATEVIAALA